MAAATDSKKPVDSFAELDDSGDFKRSASQCRSWVKADGSSDFAPEAGRYTLYISYACPWASRCYAVLAMKGLLDAVDVVSCHPTWGYTKPDVEGDDHRGWMFTDDRPDPLGHGTVRDIYEKTNAVFTKPTVPILFDRKTNTVVNNESADIIKMFNDEFNSIASNPGLDLFPADLQDAMDEVNSWVYSDINNGVYRCGFATKQKPYLEAIDRLYAALDKAEGILSKQRFLLGSRLTAADIRLFVTLVRFDQVYVVHFKCNRKRILDYPALHAYMLDVYQTPGVAETVNMDDIKRHYYTSHPNINPHGIIAEGPQDDLNAPHGRDTAFVK